MKTHLRHADVLYEGVIDLWREEIVRLDAAQVLQDLVALRCEELAPQHLHKNFVEEANTLLVARLVENLVVDWPQIRHVGLHHLGHGRVESLAAHDAVRAHHEEDGHLAARLVAQVVRKAQRLAKEEALSGKVLLPDALVGLNREGVLLQPAPEKTNEGTPN